MKKLVIGIPKGSLEEQTIRLFEKAGIRIMNGSRSYYPASSDPEIKIMIARPQDIPLYVEKGVMDCGITGRDWVIERSAKVEEFAEMEYAKSGIGTVKWVLAAPKGNGINSVKDLEENFNRAYGDYKKISYG